MYVHAIIIKYIKLKSNQTTFNKVPTELIIKKYTYIQK